MKKIQIGLLLATSLSLASCNSVIQQAADNTDVSVLPLADKKLTGTMGASEAAPLSLHAQANYTVPLSSGPVSFGDFDAASLPSALQNPSGLDVHVSFRNVTLSCTPTASPLTVTISNVALTVSDAAHGTASVSVSPNAVLTLTKSGAGYRVSSNDILLKASWAKFKAIVVKSGAESANTVTLNATARFNDGAIGCVVTLDLASTLKQNIRF